MKDEFEDYVFRELDNPNPHSKKNLIKANQAELVGAVKVSVEEDSHDGVKIILKKDKNDTIKEIKFVCSCGQTKSIILDYSE
ncbi:MAG: hypothetical protein Q8933_05805 [Bacteroidota bacterium]|nr:hypothetical protein [Bacteroidota bacterium]MDP4191436.1 hypothetical protein [Bacteroidota bacterium]MDP4194383.1 hypothetical protein [Bacteroidota bacterium]